MTATYKLVAESLSMLYAVFLVGLFPLVVLYSYTLLSVGFLLKTPHIKL